MTNSFRDEIQAEEEMLKILLVTKDESLVASFEQHIQDQGESNHKSKAKIDSISEIFKVPDIVFKKSHNILIVDLAQSLKDLNKFDLLSFLRNLTTLPILVICNPGDELECLERGADGFVLSPLNMQLMFLQINVFISRSSKKIPNLVIKDELVCNFNDRKVYINNNLVLFSATEYSILEALAKSSNHRVEKDRLLKIIENPNGDNKLVDVYICKIRQKLKDAGGTYHYIETVWKGGFRLMTSPEKLFLDSEDQINTNSVKVFLKVGRPSKAAIEARKQAQLAQMHNENQAAESK